MVRPRTGHTSALSRDPSFFEGTSLRETLGIPGLALHRPERLRQPAADRRGPGGFSGGGRLVYGRLPTRPPAPGPVRNEPASPQRGRETAGGRLEVAR